MNVSRRRYMGGNEGPQIPYEEQYFTIVSLENNNTISFKASSANLLKTISVSIDGGTTWTEKTSSTDGTELATLNSGNKVLIKGSNSAYASSTSGYNRFIATADFYVQGNIQSLRYGDAFIGENSVATNFAAYLFYYSTKLISAEHLVFPTGLNNYCYQGMFAYCSGLVVAPEELPATGANMQCYHMMFTNCSNLLKSPIINTVNLTNGLYCCNQMFRYCRKLNYITILSSTYPPNANYTSSWVEGVAANGTFVKNASATNWPTSISGIPSGWTVIDAT